MSSKEIVIKRIKYFREINNYTQSYVADKLDISQNTYSLIEKGETRLVLDRIEQIADIYEVPITELFKGFDKIGNEVTAHHSNTPPPLSPMEKSMYEQTIKYLENNLNRLYGLIEQITKNATNESKQLNEKSNSDGSEISSYNAQ